MMPGNCDKPIIVIFLFLCAWNYAAFSQISPDGLRQSLYKNKYTTNGQVKALYARLNYEAAWMNKGNEINRDTFFQAIKESADMGLREKDYQSNYIVSYRNGTIHLRTAEDSIEADIRITDAAIHFYNDIEYGNTKPALGYNGLLYNPLCRDIPALLADCISKKTLGILIDQLSPAFSEIMILQNKIQWFNRVMSESGFKEISITSKKVNGTNKSLISKLYQLGLTNIEDKNIPDSTLKQKVREAQRQFGLLADGVLRSTIMQELNIPLSVRLQELNLSINYYRWLNCLIQNQSAIVVNIPAAYMKVYVAGKIFLEMRMVVGKPSTPTPTLSSTVSEVILYPYWHVPYSIATKELLPLIKHNTAFIDAGNYQVLNKAGKIIDPYSINWHALSRSYFPYIIRQSTGCDNSLGLLKLNFYNPFGVYLHDTPMKSFFSMNKRYFSHGCMRMEKPMELGHLVLKNNQMAIDTLEQKGCLRNQAPVTVPADLHLPVIVWYNPAGVDSTGRVLFFEDVYHKFPWIK